MTESTPEKKLRHQKRYDSEAMILSDIDKNDRRIARLMKKAEALESEADLLAMADDGSNEYEIRNLREEADGFRDQAENARNIRGKKLKNTLAAFRTSTLPGEHEGTIVLQKV